MEAKLQHRVQRYGWDAAAELYDSIWRTNLLPIHDAMFNLADIKPGESVCDLACGSGFAALRAAEIVKQKGKVLATDISAEMVKLVKKHTRRLDLMNVVTKRRAAEDPGSQVDEFDIALCSLGLMYSPHPEKVLTAMYKNLKPGGRAIAAVWGARKNCSWAHIFPIVDSVVQSDVCPLFFSIGTGDSLENSFKDAGFNLVTSHRVTCTMKFDSEQSLLEAHVDAGPVALAAKRFDKATREKVDVAFLKSVSEHRYGDEFRLPGEFVVAIGWKPENVIDSH